MSGYGVEGRNLVFGIGVSVFSTCTVTPPPVLLLATSSSSLFIVAVDVGLNGSQTWTGYLELAPSLESETEPAVRMR